MNRVTHTHNFSTDDGYGVVTIQAGQSRYFYFTVTVENQVTDHILSLMRTRVIPICT